MTELKTELACVILAAGHGSRMKSSLPKVLHQVGHRPMLHHVMALGQTLGAARQVVVVGAGGEAVAAAAKEFEDKAAIAVQDPPQGTGHAVQMALPALEGFEGTVLILYADTPLMRAETAAALIGTVTEGAALSVLGFETDEPGAYGRLITDDKGDLDRIVEFKDASEDERAVTLCNAGLMAAPAALLREHLPKLSNDNAQGEYYLTDLPAMAKAAGGRCAIVRAGIDETSGVNRRTELAAAEAVFQNRRREEMMDAGVTLIDPSSVWFAHDTQIAQDVVIGPHVVFGPGVTVGEGVRIEAFSHLEGCTVQAGASIGPYARLRPGTDVGAGAKIGNFVETKKAVLGPGAKVSHLTYLGDAQIGAEANIGAGTITCNYDGYDKHLTVIGEGAFVGSNSSLVAPVTIGKGAYVGSGSVVTKSVPDDALTVARGRQMTKEDWAKSFRARKEPKEQEHSMCGIVGIIGKEDVSESLVEGLSRLEYRGYDSAGIATIAEGRLGRRRAVGKLGKLRERLNSEPLGGKIGIGHTRWATHGAPTEANAHPHATSKVAIVHNGIIENFAELREELVAAGATFESETDTETVAQLVEHYLAKGKPPAEAFSSALGRLEGAFALAVMVESEPRTLYCARRGSPLAIGRGEGEMFVGSDAYALAPFTRRVTYLSDGDWAVVTPQTVSIFDADGGEVFRPEQLSDASAALVDKGEHRHFMAKEIHEQPEVLGHAISAYVDPVARKVVLPEGGIDFSKVTALTMSACGTAFYATLVAKYWFETYARLPVETDIASELRYRDVPYREGGAALFISQSGETADTLAALRDAKEAGQQVGAIVNVPESTIAREADALYPTHAGPEIGVASTKAFTCQLATLASLAIAAGVARGVLSREDEERLTGVLLEAPRHVAEMLHADKSLEAIAAEVATARDVLYLGRGGSYPLALEGALKLKEISYIHAEGYAAGELKHGPIALIDEAVPVVVLAPRDAVFDKTISNMHEVMARGGKCLLVSSAEGLAEAARGGKVWGEIAVPEVDPLIAPIVYSVPVQLLAYHAAVAKGTDVDQPRNLAKSVTVE